MGDQVNENVPGSHIEGPIIIGVQIVAVGAQKATYQQVGHVVTVLEIEIGAERGRTQGERAFGRHEEPAPRNALAREIHDRLNHAAPARSVADDEVSETVE